MNYENLNLNDLSSINLLDDNTYEYNGYKVPRVTNIISACLHEEYITQWANGIGFKRLRYTQMLNKAADYGTLVHEALETYIKTGIRPKNAPNDPITAFETWWSQIHNGNEIKVLGQEFKLSCPYYGGTYDMLLEINGAPWLVDFKTSNHMSFRYCLQLAAYREMLIFNNIVSDISGVIVLRLNKNKPTFEEFVLDFRNPKELEFINQCTQMFHAMVYTYWNRMYLENEFKKFHHRRN